MAKKAVWDGIGHEFSPKDRLTIMRASNAMDAVATSLEDQGLDLQDFIEDLETFLKGCPLPAGNFYALMGLLKELDLLRQRTAP